MQHVLRYHLQEDPAHFGLEAGVTSDGARTTTELARELAGRIGADVLCVAQVARGRARGRGLEVKDLRAALGEHHAERAGAGDRLRPE